MSEEINKSPEDKSPVYEIGERELKSKLLRAMAGKFEEVAQALDDDPQTGFNNDSKYIEQYPKRDLTEKITSSVYEIKLPYGNKTLQFAISPREVPDFLHSATSFTEILKRRCHIGSKDGDVNDRDWATPQLMDDGTVRFTTELVTDSISS